MKTTLEISLEYLNWKGGTIHQVKAEFVKMNQGEKDSFIQNLIKELPQIKDLTTVQWFTNYNTRQMIKGA